MKLNSIYLLLALAATTTLSGCFSSTKSNNILDMSELIPARESSKDDWGFYSPDGEFYLADEYESRPSSVINGYFSVEEGKSGYTLYKFDKKKPTAVLEELKAVGFVSDGLVPIVRKGERITVVNTSGETQFTLDPVNGKEITWAAPGFAEGRLLIHDENGNYGYVATDGSCVIKPKYNAANEFAEGLAVVSERDEDNNMRYSVINDAGDIVFKIKQKAYSDTFKDGMLIVQDDNDRLIFLDNSGNQVLKCPSKCKKISEYNKEFIIYRTDDYKYGVINFEGENIIRAKYDGIALYGDNRFICNTKDGDDREIVVLDEAAEELFDIDDYTLVSWAGRYGLIGSDKNGFEFLDDEGKPLKNAQFEEVGPSLNASYAIYSDYFDMNAAVDAFANLFTDRGVDKYCLGAAPADYFSAPADYTYRSTVRVDSLALGYKYKVTAELNFNQTIADYTYESYGYYNYTRRYYWRDGSEIAYIRVNIDTDTEWGNDGSIALVKKLKDKGFKLIDQTKAESDLYGAVMTNGDLCYLITSSKGGNEGNITVAKNTSENISRFRQNISNFNELSSEYGSQQLERIEFTDSVACEEEILDVEGCE